MNVDCFKLTEGLKNSMYNRICTSKRFISSTKVILEHVYKLNMPIVGTLPMKSFLCNVSFY
jgi:hypothetical protein